MTQDVKVSVTAHGDRMRALDGFGVGAEGRVFAGRAGRRPHRGHGDGRHGGRRQLRCDARGPGEAVADDHPGGDRGAGRVAGRRGPNPHLRHRHREVGRGRPGPRRVLRRRSGRRRRWSRSPSSSTPRRRSRSRPTRSWREGSIAMDGPRKAVVLLSGGLDSATALAEARAEGFETYALTVAYGQRHAVEIEAARRVAKAMGVARHVETTIDLRAFGGSALTADLDVPKDRRPRPDGRAASRSPMSRRGTRSSSRSPWPGPRRWGRSTSSSASTASTTRAIPIAGPSSSAPSRRWPTWRPRPASRARATSAIHAPLLHLTKEQIIRRAWPWASTTA